MTDKKYTIRTMARNNLDLAIDWTNKEGWNPGSHDADCFYATDPHGFFMGFLDDEPISSISTVAYNNSYAFVGFYIVKPEYRGQGYGIKIWRHAMKYAGKRNLGLDGIADQQPNYIRSGFKLAYHNLTHKGSSKRFPSNSHIVDLRSIDFEKITSYDQKCFPVARTQFLNYWINGPERTSLGYLDREILTGYGVIRKCLTWYKIGPLFADNIEIAEAIFQALISSLPDKSEIGMDIPEVNSDALKLAAKYHLSEAFRLGRMYTKTPPKIDLQKVFSVSGYELG